MNEKSILNNKELKDKLGNMILISYVLSGSTYANNCNCLLKGDFAFNKLWTSKSLAKDILFIEFDKHCILTIVYNDNSSCKYTIVK
jgi:hypothetical protein